MSRPILEFRGVSASYLESITALQGLSLTVREGEFAALLGANGAGKTTLLKAASNLLPAERGRITAGEIRFDGRDVRSEPPSRLVRGGLVPVLEGRRCFRNLSIEENLMIGAIGAGLSQAETRRQVDLVYALFPRVAERRRSAAGLTSGGEQQMTAIGRGLMARPRVFLLDEPSMGLAPLVVAEIFDALSRLNRDEGLTLLVAEQNSAVALRHAHHAIVVENGRGVLSGRASELASRDDIRAAYLGGAVETHPN
ncbi:MAG: ABC transporter ATP-binding protein [Rhodovulum sulfidophilum]|uniref:ABC transporter ATP-binding protein n=1 Tax=Rhodovulum sulfidophilum TaxID=35806 RepID=A0A2W5Q4D2_RHOSU|nr:MAG: ABC transporter ATP-binding protein [Rhodovulum sulfidophilum]